MAITPQEAFQPRPEEERRAADLEARIDEKLRTIDRHTRNMTYGVPSDVNRRVLGMVIRQYEAAGWTVKYESDQREGDYLVFSAKSGTGQHIDPYGSGTHPY